MHVHCFKAMHMCMYVPIFLSWIHANMNFCQQDTCIHAVLKAVHICMYLTVSDCILKCISECILGIWTVFRDHTHTQMVHKQVLLRQIGRPQQRAIQESDSRLGLSLSSRSSSRASNSIAGAIITHQHIDSPLSVSQTTPPPFAARGEQNQSRSSFSMVIP